MGHGWRVPVRLARPRPAGVARRHPGPQAPRRRSVDLFRRARLPDLGLGARSAFAQGQDPRPQRLPAPLGPTRVRWGRDRPPRGKQLRFARAPRKYAQSTRVRPQPDRGSETPARSSEKLFRSGKPLESRRFREPFGSRSIASVPCTRA